MSTAIPGPRAWWRPRPALEATPASVSAPSLVSLVLFLSLSLSLSHSPPRPRVGATASRVSWGAASPTSPHSAPRVCLPFSRPPAPARRPFLSLLYRAPPQGLQGSPCQCRSRNAMGATCADCPCATHAAPLSHFTFSPPVTWKIYAPCFQQGARKVSHGLSIFFPSSPSPFFQTKSIDHVSDRAVGWGVGGARELEKKARRATTHETREGGR